MVPSANVVKAALKKERQLSRAPVKADLEQLHILAEHELLQVHERR